MCRAISLSAEVLVFYRKKQQKHVDGTQEEGHGREGIYAAHMKGT
jgi:hypothetical protein